MKIPRTHSGCAFLHQRKQRTRDASTSSRYNTAMPRTTSSTRTPRVTTIGAATRDMFIQGQRFHTINDPHAPDGVDTCFPLGSKIDLENIIFETGGGATNAAVTFTRFGIQASCIARIGKDLGGREIQEQLRREGVTVTHLQTDPRDKTAYSVILLSKSGQRAVLVYRGASRNIQSKEIPWKSLSSEWVYLTSLGGNMPLLRDVFAQQKRQRFHLAWNPGNAELELGLKRLTPWLIQTDILIFNREEAAELAEVPPRDLEAIIHHLGTFPRQALIVTDGQRGAYVHARGTIWYAPPLAAKRMNTTGAGDAFGSAFVATAILTGDLEKSLRAAMLNAKGVITHMGAKAGILKRPPTAKELASVRIKKT